MDLLPLTTEEISETFDNVHLNCEIGTRCCHRDVLKQLDQSVSVELLDFFEHLTTVFNLPAASVMIFSEGVLCGLVLSEVLKLKSLAATE